LAAVSETDRDAGLLARLEVKKITRNRPPQGGLFIVRAAGLEARILDLQGLKCEEKAPKIFRA
jgi:hypothetical protein